MRVLVVSQVLKDDTRTDTDLAREVPDVFLGPEP